MNFTALAARRLNEQLPDLGKYVLSFTDVSDESPEDTELHMGIFTLKVKSSTLYVPVIGQGTIVYPIECIFYDNNGTKFLPVSREVIRDIIDNDSTLGESAELPLGVQRNPSLLEAVVPPRTGKFVYASSRLTSLVDSIPSQLRKFILDGIDEDTKEDLSAYLDIDELVEALKRNDIEYNPPAQVTPSVVTDGDLTDEQKQEVLNKGYAVLNAPTVPVVAVESEDRDEFMQCTGLSEGESTIAIDTDGRGVGVVRLPMQRGYTQTYLTSERTVHTDEPFICYARTEKPDVYAHQTYVPLSRVVSGQVIIPFTGFRYLSPVTVRNVVVRNSETTIHTDSETIVVSPSIRTLYDKVGNTVYMSDKSQAILVESLCSSLERNINVAQYNHNRLEEVIMPHTVKLMYRDGVFAIDGREIGPEVRMLEHSVVRWSMPVAQAEKFMDSAKSKGQIFIKMAAESGITGPSPIPNYGDTPMPATPITGDKEERSRGMSTIRNAVTTNDKQIVQASIIAQILCNTDMDYTIEEYIPDISEAVDKLGRALMLIRINTNKLSEDMSSDSINSLVTSVRNVFRDLGNACIKLKAMVRR